MKTEIFSTFTLQELKDAFKEVLDEHDAQKYSSNSSQKTFTINKVSKILGRSHAKVTSMIKEGVIKSADGKRISEKALNDYLKTICL